MNNSGNLVETIPLEDVSEGTYNEEINISSYDEGIYFIIFEVENGFTTRKLFIEK